MCLLWCVFYFLTSPLAWGFMLIWLGVRCVYNCSQVQLCILQIHPPPLLLCHLFILFSFSKRVFLLPFLQLQYSYTSTLLIQWTGVTWVEFSIIFLFSVSILLCPCFEAVVFMSVSLVVQLFWLQCSDFISLKFLSLFTVEFSSSLSRKAGEGWNWENFLSL